MLTHGKMKLKQKILFLLSFLTLASFAVYSPASFAQISCKKILTDKTGLESKLTTALQMGVPPSIRETANDLHGALIEVLVPRLQQMSSFQQKKFLTALSQIEFRAIAGTELGDSNALQRKLVLDDKLLLFPELAYVVLRHEISHLERSSKNLASVFVSRLALNADLEEESQAFADQYDFIRLALNKRQIKVLRERINSADAEALERFQPYLQDNKIDYSAVIRSGDADLIADAQTYVLLQLEGHLQFISSALTLNRADYISKYLDHPQYVAKNDMFNAIRLVLYGMAPVAGTASIALILHSFLH